MKNRIKRLSKSTICIILSVIMIVSMLAVGMITSHAYAISGGNVYFIKPNTWDNLTLLYQVEGESGSHQVALNKVTNATNLYYWVSDDMYKSKWWAVIDADWSTGTSTSSIDTLKGYAAGPRYSNTFEYGGFENSSYWYLVKPNDMNDSTTGSAITFTNTENRSGRDNLMKKDIKAILYSDSTESLGSYAKSNTGGQVNIDGWYFSANDKVETSKVIGDSDTSLYNGALGADYVFEAIPNDHYSFDGWYSDSALTTLVSTDNPYTFSPTAATTLYAKFSYVEDKFDVTVSSGGNGSVTVDGQAHTSGETISVGDITKASVQAVPDTGYSFSKWTVTGGVTNAGVALDNNSTTNPLATVGATADGTLTANFTKDTYTLSKGAETNGTFTVTGTLENGTKAQYGDTVNVSCVPATGYTVSTVTFGPSGTGTNAIKGADNNTWSFSMPAGNTQVNVTFVKEDFAITKSVSPNSSGNLEVQLGGSDVSKYNINDTLTLVASPSSASNYVYELDYFIVDGAGFTNERIDSNNSTLNMNGRTGPLTVTAYFKHAGFDLHYNDNSSSNNWAYGTYTAVDGTSVNQAGSSVKMTDNGDDTYSYEVNLTEGTTYNFYVTSRLAGQNSGIYYKAPDDQVTAATIGTPTPLDVITTGNYGGKKGMMTFVPESSQPYIVTFDYSTPASPTFTINYKEPQYTVTASATSGGSVSPASDTAGETYNTAEFTATNNPGYDFTGWTLGSNVTFADDYDEDDLTIKVHATANSTVTANFTEKAIETISVDVDEHSTVTVSGSSVAGQNQTFIADGNFTAHVGDVIVFSAAGNPSDSYTYDQLYFTEGGDKQDGESFTVVENGSYKITATSKEKNGYYFYVNTNAGATAAVTIGSDEPITVAASSRRKFFVTENATNFTITGAVSDNTKYENPVISKYVSTVSGTPTVIASGTAQTKSDSSGCTYYVTAGDKGVASNNKFVYFDSKPETATSLSQTTYFSGYANSTFNGKTGYINKVTVNLPAGDYSFHFADENSHTYHYDSSQKNIDPSEAEWVRGYTWKEGSSSNYSMTISEADAGYYTFYMLYGAKESSRYYSWVDVVKGSGTSAKDVTAFDTYYLGGRFRIKDTDTGQYVYTDESIGSWQAYSIRMPFTETETSGLYKLATNQTIAELSENLNNKLPYFVVHDKKNIIARNDDDSLGNHFENYNSSTNSLGVTTLSTSPSSTNEMLFNDTSSNSDGLVVIYYNKNTGKLYYEAEHETAAVAASVTLDTYVGDDKVTNAAVGTEITLTATVDTPHANAGTMTYTFYDRDGKTVLGTVETAASTASITTTDDYVRTNTYKVVVSSTGKDSTGTGKTLREIYDSTDFQFKNAEIFRTNVDLNDSSESLLNRSNWKTESIHDSSLDSFTVSDLAAGDTFEFALTTKLPTTSDHKSLKDARVEDFYIDEKLSRYCDIKKRSITVNYVDENQDTQWYTIRTYEVTPRTNCSDPTIYIDTTALTVVEDGQTKFYPGKIYARATYEATTEKTKHDNPGADEMVTYYFAEKADQTDISKTGAGVRIAYWNNSTDIIQVNNDFKIQKPDTTWSSDWKDAIDISAQKVDVTEAVRVDPATGVVSTVDNDGITNSIYVDATKLYDSGLGDSATSVEFKIYKVELPIWATSFAFVGTDDKALETRSIKKNSSAYLYGSLLLNHNRVYLLYQDSSSNKYTKAVVLDKALWSNAADAKNNVGTKTFKANAINYNTAYGDDGKVNTDFNSWLSTFYGNSYNRALYFGYFPKDYEGSALNNFKISNNLAMRFKNPTSGLKDESDERYYFASVQNLVAEKLDTDNLNENGFPMLEAYADADRTQKVLMPLFNYPALATNKSGNTNTIIDQQYLGVDFPMYESSFNGITTYSYDSSTDPNRQINKIGDTDKYNFVIGGYETAKDDLGYIPFKDNAQCAANSKYGNGTELDVEFFMSNTGSLTDKNGNKQDITFNFTGDDDVWVYVDGVLVLDLGGDHKASAGSINFTDMKVYYKTATKDADLVTSACSSTETWPVDANNVVTVDMQALLEANGVNFNNKDGNTKHTFQMFYMERGQFDSNMSVSYNLPQASGLNIKNQITANNVNEGLKEAALYAANGDYFTYGVEAALSSGSMYDNLDGVYTTPNPAATVNAPASPDPQTPLNTDVKRSYNTSFWYNDLITRFSKEYILSKSSSTPTAGGTFAESTDWTALSGITYNLSDMYLAPNSENVDNLDVTGITEDNGEFHLLGGQSAQFEDKITPHSFVKIYQSADLGKAGANETTGLLEYNTVSDNNTSNYYLTSYSIYDDHSKTYIKEKTGDIINSGNNAIYAEDNSANSEMFYFSDYGKEGSSAAMTVTYYNDIAVGDIRISKEYNGNENTEFYFDLKFANIFGNLDDAQLKALVNYNMITYDVIDTATGAMINRGVTYGTTGIKLCGGQTAVISGVPVETRYQVTERHRNGSQLIELKKTITGPDDGTLANATPAHGYEETLNKAYLVDRNTSSTTDTNVVIDGDTYYVNMIPRVSESYVNGAGYKTTSYVDFKNEKTSVQITFQYYDRSVQNGKAANINEAETLYTTKGSLSDTLENDNAKIKEALAELIQGAAVEFNNNCAVNVVDDYKIWTSQAAAEEGIGNEINIKTLKPYKEEANYSEYKSYHTNSKSQLMDSVDAKTNVNKWILYKSGGNVIDAESLDNADTARSITNIYVWIFNTPHKYNVNIYGGDDISDFGSETTVSINGTNKNVIVANKTQTDKVGTWTDVYYNQRLGKELNAPEIDRTSYISQYSRAAFRADIEPRDYVTNQPLTRGSKTYRFCYWAYDPAGKIVASTDAYYYYRVTKDLDLYAVYAESDIPTTSHALSIYNDRNDIYVDSSGTSRTRMNVVINPYNCNDSDTNIRQTALVCINLSNQLAEAEPEDIIRLFNQYRDQLGSILVKQTQTSFTDKPTMDLTLNNSKVVNVTLSTKGFIYDAFHNNTDAFTDVQPTTKNRVQYTLGMKTASLKDYTKLMYVGAMYYNGNYEGDKNHWIISDNCLYYVNGQCQDLDFGLTN